jgi:hypothetical protein
VPATSDPVSQTLPRLTEPQTLMIAEPFGRILAFAMDQVPTLNCKDGYVLRQSH